MNDYNVKGLKSEKMGIGNCDGSFHRNSAYRPRLSSIRVDPDLPIVWDVLGCKEGYILANCNGYLSSNEGSSQLQFQLAREGLPRSRRRRCNRWGRLVSPRRLANRR